MSKKQVLFFSSSTCGPCRLAKQQLTESKLDELNIEIKNYSAEIDWEDFAKYGVASVPTFISVDENGFEKSRKVGFKSLEDIKEL